jgi:predicted DNA-binding ribbon-helix-helix protein
LLGPHGHGHAAAFAHLISQTTGEHDVSSSRLINRNVVAGRGRTSMRLEPEVWDALTEICRRERQDLNGLVRQIEATGHAGGRTSAVRVFVVEYFRNVASEIDGSSPTAPLLQSIPQAA